MNNNDLISRSALLELAHNHVGGTVDCNDIARFPAVDAEVVRHGRWLADVYNMETYETRTVLFDNWKHSDAYCSICKAYALCNGHEESVDSRYCPNCGAKMDGDGSEGT